ncbi:hypothetical protein [Acetobacter oryzoeni]
MEISSIFCLSGQALFGFTIQSEGRMPEKFEKKSAKGRRVNMTHHPSPVPSPGDQTRQQRQVS